MNPNKLIKNLKGETYPKTFPSQRELNELPKIKVRNEKGVEIETPDFEKLERETVGNVILNCITNYIVRDRREGYYINLIAQSILEGKKVEFKDKIKNFLIEVLDDQTLRREKKVNEKGEVIEEIKGLYQAWVIAQCKEEILRKESYQSEFNKKVEEEKKK